MDQGEASYGLDDLSRLPDELLLLIVSLLPMKDAIRTSALSTRWRYLYVSRSNLDFYSLGSCMNVIGSANHVFDHRYRRPINRFRICWTDQGHVDPMHSYRWIKCVMWHGIQEIDIDIPAFLQVPDSLFTCKTLVTLRLKLKYHSGGRELELPAKVFLPRLKVLLLHKVISFPDGDDACERLFSHCPVLEHFDYQFQDNKDCKLIVCHPTLKRLAIRGEGYINHSGNYEIVINAPNVVYLEYSRVPFDCHVVIDDVQSLIEAAITLSAGNLITGVSNIKKLSIAGITLESFEEVNIPMPMFHNLTHLSIFCDYNMGMRAILRFLTYCESLETLDLEGLPTDFNLDDSHIQEGSGAIFWFRLKTITITSLSGNANEVKSIKYLLQNARVLDSLEIDTSDIPSERRLGIRELLLTLPRASDTCNVVLVDDVQSLIEANISFEYEYESDVELFTLSAGNLIRRVSNIQKLSISGGTLESFEEFNIPMPTFHNLTHLTIYRGNCMGTRAILRFLT